MGKIFAAKTPVRDEAGKKVAEEAKKAKDAQDLLGNQALEEIVVPEKEASLLATGEEEVIEPAIEQAADEEEVIEAVVEAAQEEDVVEEVVEAAEKEEVLPEVVEAAAEHPKVLKPVLEELEEIEAPVAPAAVVKLADEKKTQPAR